MYFFEFGFNVFNFWQHVQIHKLRHSFPLFTLQDPRPSVWFTWLRYCLVCVLYHIPQTQNPHIWWAWLPVKGCISHNFHHIPNFQLYIHDHLGSGLWFTSSFHYFTEDRMEWYSSWSDGWCSGYFDDVPEDRAWEKHSYRFLDTIHWDWYHYHSTDQERSNLRHCIPGYVEQGIEQSQWSSILRKLANRKVKICLPND